MVVAYLGRFALPAGPGALLGRRERGVPPELVRRGRPEVQVPEGQVGRAEEAAVRTTRRRGAPEAAGAERGVRLEEAVRRREEVGGGAEVLLEEGG